MHKPEEERRTWRVRQLDRFITESERHISMEMELVAELIRYHIDVSKYIERLYQFEGELRSRIQERNFLTEPTEQTGGDQILALASKIRGLCLTHQDYSAFGAVSAHTARSSPQP
jgi:hypothetical protein